MAYTGEEATALEKASAYLADIAWPEGSSEVQCEAAMVLSVELGRLARSLPATLVLGEDHSEKVEVVL